VLQGCLYLAMCCKRNLCALCQVAGGKHPRDEGEPPRLSLATALPLSVWQDHLTPRLSLGEAVQLRVVCKALRGVVHECPVGVGAVRANMLKEALKCFPAAQSMDIILKGKPPAPRKSRLVQLLRQHGGTLKRVVPQGDGAEQLLERAVRGGALPKLTYFKMTASSTEHGQWLSDGRLRQLEEVCVALRSADDSPASMEHLRQLPNLRSLEIEGEQAPMREAVFPAFIPPSLKTLTLDHLHGPVLESLLLQLPPMLQASGAGLVELQVISTVKISDECGPRLLVSFRRARPRSSASASSAPSNGASSNWPSHRSWRWAWRAAVRGSSALSCPGWSSRASPPPAPPSSASPTCNHIALTTVEWA
jgi:hypothetical protein